MQHTEKSKANKLERLNKKWVKNCTCALKKEATQAVLGYGSASADIVFIGEAPGKKEDLEGRPFIGAGGKMLDKMLESIKLAREDIYITNTVKYRPPDNRDPTPVEKEACYKWLTEELNTIQPKLIVFLGRISLNSFFPKEKIGEVHGQLFRGKLKGVKTENFLALYHPAAALYNGSLRQTLFDDFKKIPKVLKKI